MTAISNIYDYSVCWQMSPHERASILHLIERLPHGSTAIEIGCYTGGFLRQLDLRFAKVRSIDISHNKVDPNLRLSRVSWYTGPSHLQISKALTDLELPVSFILIDGDHSTTAVFNDLHECLALKPEIECVILVHDSWYEPSRRALREYPFKYHKYVHFVDLDFCTGTYANGNWVGGLALIHLLPSPREGVLEVRESDKLTYERVTK